MSNLARKIAAQAELRVAKERAALLTPRSAAAQAAGEATCTPLNAAASMESDSFSSAEHVQKRARFADPVSQPSGKSADSCDLSATSVTSCDSSPASGAASPVTRGSNPPIVPVAAAVTRAKPSPLVGGALPQPSAAAPSVPAGRVMSGIPPLLLTASTLSDESPGNLLFSFLDVGLAVSKHLSLGKLRALFSDLGASSACLSLSKVDSLILLFNIRGTIGKLENRDDTSWVVDDFRPSPSDFNRALFPSHFGLPDDLAPAAPPVAPATSSIVASPEVANTPSPDAPVEATAPSDAGPEARATPDPDFRAEAA
jgi:hypothetical protein